MRVSPARTYTVVSLVLALLLATTTTLARIFHDEKHERADAHFARGQALIAEGRAEEGIEQLRAALTLDRGNPAFALVLGGALVDAGLPREAENYLNEVIRADPTSGPGNLLHARVTAALANADPAVYYRRAYYGSWPDDEAAAARVAVGFELVDHLLATGEVGQAQVVLTQLAADAGDDAGLQLRLARRFLDAGAPADAVPLLEAVTAVQDDVGPIWRTLASAHFQAGNDQAAARAATRAVALDPDDRAAARIGDLANEVVALDPTLPRLRTRERTRRARVLVERTIAALDACAPPPEGARPAGVRAEARRALDRRTRPAWEDEALLDLAIRVWRVRQARCPAVTPDADGLARLMARLGEPEAAP